MIVEGKFYWLMFMKAMRRIGGNTLRKSKMMINFHAHRLKSLLIFHAHRLKFLNCDVMIYFCILNF